MPNITVISIWKRDFLIKDKMSFADAFVMIEAALITDLARLDCFNEGARRDLIITPTIKNDRLDFSLCVVSDAVQCRNRLLVGLGHGAANRALA